MTGNDLPKSPHSLHILIASQITISLSSSHRIKSSAPKCAFCQSKRIQCTLNHRQSLWTIIIWTHNRIVHCTHYLDINCIYTLNLNHSQQLQRSYVRQSTLYTGELTRVLSVPHHLSSNYHSKPPLQLRTQQLPSVFERVKLIATASRCIQRFVSLCNRIAIFLGPATLWTGLGHVRDRICGSRSSTMPKGEIDCNLQTISSSLQLILRIK